MGGDGGEDDVEEKNTYEATLHTVPMTSKECNAFNSPYAETGPWNANHPFRPDLTIHLYAHRARLPRRLVHPLEIKRHQEYDASLIGKLGMMRVSALHRLT